MNITPDEIERSIHIDAAAERVYDLIARAGWWINDGAITDNVVTVEGSVSLVTHHKYGTFRVWTVAERPPHYVAFRWFAGDLSIQTRDPASTTLVEFWVEERPGGVTLKVRESGFRSVSDDEAVRQRNYDDNLKGWLQELGAARSYLETA